MSYNSRRFVILALLAVSVGLLLPGLFQPVLSIRGVLKPEGVASMAPKLIEEGINDDTVNLIKSMMSPTVVNLLQSSGTDLRKTIIDQLTPQITKGLLKNVGEITVFNQTRSIAGSVQHLYQVHSPLPATLILIFSVIVPFGKIALVLCALFMKDAKNRRGVLGFVELIAKWSMADVFVVALFIAYLAAQATQTSSGAAGSSPPLVVFTAVFGPGFYWFASYCIFSLASQQFASRWLTRAAVTEQRMN
jgi:hypothetical protein